MTLLACGLCFLVGFWCGRRWATAAVLNLIHQRFPNLGKPGLTPAQSLSPHPLLSSTPTNKPNERPQYEN
jgi:hypothetical protein